MKKFASLAVALIFLTPAAVAQDAIRQRCANDGFAAGTEGNRLCALSIFSATSTPMKADLSRRLYLQAVSSEGERRCGPENGTREWVSCMAPLRAAYANFDRTITELEVTEPPQTGTTCYPIGGGAFHCE